MSRQSRSGFTLVEMMMAVLVIAVVVTSLARFAASAIRTAAWAQVRTVATSVAKDQLEHVREHPDYTTLVSTFNNQTLTGFTGYANMTRVTRVTRVTATSPLVSDYTTITVRVTDPRMTTPVNLTIVRAP